LGGCAGIAGDDEFKSGGAYLPMKFALRFSMKAAELSTTTTGSVMMFPFSRSLVSGKRQMRWGFYRLPFTANR
jgi:hypothetical protein